jgi:hypothetical protein
MRQLLPLYSKDPISAMAMAPDASTLAVGNCEGHVSIVSAASLGGAAQVERSGPAA